MRGSRIHAAGSAADRELQVHLSNAERALSHAVELCRRMASRDHPERRRADGIARELHHALQAVQRVGHMDSLIDTSDPDLMSEDKRSEQRLAQRKERRELNAQKVNNGQEE